jgi:alkylhydroperoxidase family enzyme
MYEFKLYDINTAPTESRTELEKIKLQQGNIHNIYAIMAESPLLLKGHTALRDLFEATGLSIQERRIVLLTASRENGSAYSVALQSDAAEKNEVPVEVIEAIRASKPLKDKKLEKLRAFTAKVVNSRAQIAEKDVKGILDAGYTRANILEVILAVGMVTLTNYTNLIARTPLDKNLEPKLWKKAS